MKYILLFVTVIAMSGCTLLLGDFTVSDPPTEEQQCGPTTSAGNCFATITFEAGDAGFDATPFH